jgi:hypothetical protein
MEIRQVEYQYATVPDKPGEGLRVLSGLKSHGVNLHAYLGFPAGRGKAQLDLVAEDPDALRRAAKSLGVKLGARKRAFLVQGDDHVGAVAEVIERLSAQKINVTAAQATCAGAGRWGMVLWVPPRAFQKAAKALGA